MFPNFTQVDSHQKCHGCHQAVKNCTHVYKPVKQIGKHWFYQIGLAQSAGVFDNSLCYTI